VADSFFFGKLTYVLKEEDTNIIRGIVGEDVINIVNSFFQTHRMHKEMNATTISRIPKVANPTRLTDFILYLPTIQFINASLRF